MQPSAVIPTVVAVPPVRARPGPLDDLDYNIGNEALAAATSCSLHYPVKQGVVRTAMVDICHAKQSSLPFLTQMLRSGRIVGCYGAVLAAVLLSVRPSAVTRTCSVVCLTPHNSMAIVPLQYNTPDIFH